MCFKNKRKLNKKDIINKEIYISKNNSIENNFIYMDVPPYNDEIMIDYALERSYVIYDNLNCLSEILTVDFIEYLKKIKNIKIDIHKAYIDFELKDIKGGANNKIFKSIIDSKNKYNFKFSLVVDYKDFNYNSVENLSVVIKNEYSFFKSKLMNSDSMLMLKNIDFMLKRMNQINFPDYCHSNEEKILYTMITESKILNKTIENFDIKKIITDINYFNIFKIYIF